MSARPHGPRAVRELLLQRDYHSQLAPVRSLLSSIQAFLDRAQLVASGAVAGSPVIDRTCLAIVIDKLEEADHWAWEALQLAVDDRDGRPPHAAAEFDDPTD